MKCDALTYKILALMQYDFVLALQSSFKFIETSVTSNLQITESFPLLQKYIIQSSE